MSDRLFQSCLLVLAICSLVASAGCNSTGSKPLAAVTEMSLPWEGKKEPRRAAPDRIVGTWTEAVRHNPEVGGERGFGGRLFFYDRNGTDPIKVEGRLVVYAFVENDRQVIDHRPTRRFVFPPEQFARHETESELGVSYSFWLPWDQVGGEQTDVSLIARFEPLEGGGLVVGDQTRHRLPGRPRTSIAKGEQTAPPTPPAQPVQPAVANDPAAGQVVTTGMVSETAAADITATTIPLPRGFERHLSGNRPATTSQPITPRSAAPQPSESTPQSHRPQSAPPAQAPTGAAATLPSGASLQPPSVDSSTIPRAEIPHYQPGPMKTSVTLLSPGESVRRSLQPRSFGSQPATLPAQATPTSPSATAH